MRSHLRINVFGFLIANYFREVKVHRTGAVVGGVGGCWAGGVGGCGWSRNRGILFCIESH